MRTPLEIEAHAHGPRVYVLGYRVHHGAAGVALVIGGAVLIAHDWADRREWRPTRRSARRRSLIDVVLRVD